MSWESLPGDVLHLIAPLLPLASFRAVRRTCRHWEQWLPWRMEVIDRRGVHPPWSAPLGASRLVVPRLHKLDCQHVRLDLLHDANALAPQVRVDLFFAYAHSHHLVLHSAMVDVYDDAQQPLQRVYLDLSMRYAPMELVLFPLGSLHSLLCHFRNADRRTVVALLRRYF